MVSPYLLYLSLSLSLSLSSPRRAWLGSGRSCWSRHRCRPTQCRGCISRSATSRCCNSTRHCTTLSTRHSQLQWCEATTATSLNLLLLLLLLQESIYSSLTSDKLKLDISTKLELAASVFMLLCCSCCLIVALVVSLLLVLYHCCSCCLIVALVASLLLLLQSTWRHS